MPTQPERNSPLPSVDVQLARGVFFDLYGTLLVYGDMEQAWACWVEALRSCFLRAGLDLPPHLSARDYAQMLEQPEPPPCDGGLTVYERRIQAFAAGHGLTLNRAQVADAAEATIAAWQAYVPLDLEAAEVLAQLSKQKKLALVSNFDHYPHVKRLLAKLDIERYFHAIIISGEVGVKKPEPEIFHRALQATGLQAADVIHVGDSTDDTRGAQAAVIRAFLIDRQAPAAEVNADKQQYGDGIRVIRSLRELVPSQ